MIALRSLLFHTAFYTTLAAFGLLLPAIVLPRRWGYRIVRCFVATILWQLRHICGLSYEVRGRKWILPGSAIYASRHQSTWEALAFSVMLDDPAMILKRELAWLPIFGWAILKMDHIPVRRAGGATATATMLTTAQARRDAGRPIVIFPEGTRTRPGSAGPLKPGVLALYHNLQVPCVPVALNSGLYWPRDSWMRHPGRIVVEFLEPIEPGLDRKVFMARLQEAITSRSRELAGEAMGGGEAGHVVERAAPTSR